jgi:hypothetical protein
MTSSTADPGEVLPRSPRFPKYLSQRWTHWARMTRKPRASGRGGKRANSRSLRLDLLNPRHRSLPDLADRECNEAAPSAYRRIRANKS